MHILFLKISITIIKKTSFKLRLLQRIMTTRKADTKPLTEIVHKRENKKVTCVKGLVMLPADTSSNINLNLGKLTVKKHFSNPFNSESLQQKYQSTKCFNVGFRDGFIKQNKTLFSNQKSLIYLQ